MDFIVVAKSSTLYKRVLEVRDLAEKHGLNSASGGNLVSRRKRLCELRPDLKSAVANAILASWGQPNIEEFVEFPSSNLFYVGRNGASVRFIDVFRIDPSVPVRGISRIRIKRNGDIEVGGDIITDEQMVEKLILLGSITAKSPRAHRLIHAIGANPSCADLSVFWNAVISNLSDDDSEQERGEEMTHKELSAALLEWQSPNSRDTQLPKRYRNWGEWGAAVKGVGKLIKSRTELASFFVWYAVKSKYNSVFWPDGNLRRDEIPSPNSIREVYSAANLYGQYKQYCSENPNWESDFGEEIMELSENRATYAEVVRGLIDKSKAAAVANGKVVGVDLGAIND